MEHHHDEHHDGHREEHHGEHLGHDDHHEHGHHGHDHFEVVTDPNFLVALMGGSVIAVVAGILGCFVVWRRMAFFGDCLGHGALLGIAVGLFFHMQVSLSILLVGFCLAVFLVYMRSFGVLAFDSLLGIFAHGGLGLGLVALSFLGREDFDIHDFLFGDVFALHAFDLYWMLAGGLIIALLLWRFWHGLVLIALNEDLARAEGVAVMRREFLLMFLLALFVSISIHLVGLLLVASLLIVPAAVARFWARSHIHMAWGAVGAGVLAVALGLVFSLNYEIPSGATIASVAFIFFILSVAAAHLRQRG